jgi:hypothetical protein
MKIKSILYIFGIIACVSFFAMCSKKSKATCSDNIQNQNETAVDCGGSCAACPTCVDGIQNQNETGIDCGGPCPQCGTCSDGIKNQNETGIDCGGVCSPCPTCSDGIQNQGETGIDCGGPCGTCPIIYPTNGLYGPNYLTTNSVSIAAGNYYSPRAELPNGTSLTMIMKNQPPYSGIWYYTLGTQIGWAINTYTNYSQTFTASGQTNCDVKLFFSGSGSCLIELYENGSVTPTRTKTINW